MRLVSVNLGMEFSNSFDSLSDSYAFYEIMGGGTTSSSSLVFDNDKGEIVKAMTKPGQKAVKADKVLAALRNHSEAERRRRERINGHLTTLRSLIPGTNKMDKASLLTEVIGHLKELRRSASESTRGLIIPMDTDEVKVEQQMDGSDGTSNYSIKASLCCEYKQELLTDLKQALDTLHLKTIKEEIATLGSRMMNLFVITGCKEGEIKDTEGCQILANSVHQALKSVLDKFYASQEFSTSNSLSNKRRRVSFFNSSSSSSLGDLW